MTTEIETLRKPRTGGVTKGMGAGAKGNGFCSFLLSLPHDGRRIKPQPMKMRAGCWSHFELSGNRSSEANIKHSDPQKQLHPRSLKTLSLRIK